MQKQITASSGLQILPLSTAVQLGAAITFGIALFLVVGFAPMDAMHNAAHDARHAFAFPCH